MTGHARQRMQERCGITYTTFALNYDRAIREKWYFTKTFQDPKYPMNKSVCIKIQGKIIILVVCRQTGTIRTVMKPQMQDYMDAKARNWNIHYPVWVEEELSGDS